MAGIKVPFISYEQIMEACGGDMFSMGDILGRFGGVVESRIRAYDGSLSEEAVKDCKQEMFIILLKAVREFNPRK